MHPKDKVAKTPYNPYTDGGRLRVALVFHRFADAQERQRGVLARYAYYLDDSLNVNVALIQKEPGDVPQLIVSPLLTQADRELLQALALKDWKHRTGK